MEKDVFEIYNTGQWNDSRQPLGAYLSSAKNEMNKFVPEVKIAIFNEHRTAFYFWAKAMHNRYAPVPDLITIDLHTDTNDPDHIELLRDIDLNSSYEVSQIIYDHNVMTTRNDQQILSAQYLNLIRNAYILHSQSWHRDFIYKDVEGKDHKLLHFTEIVDFINAISQQHVIRSFLDIDCDYFTNNEDKCKEKRTINESKFDIFNSDLMNIISKDLELITIALEPDHCGGFSKCFKIFNKLQSKLFDGELFHENCRLKI